MKRKSIAAFTLCLAAALAFTGCGSSGTAETAGKVPSQSEVSIANGIVSCDGHAALAEKLGFDVAQLDYLPFDAYSTEYYSYWDEMAQINYHCEDRSVTFRQARGSDDISGDYNNYADELTVEINAAEVTLRGADDAYSVAVWEKNGFSFAISCSPALSQDDLRSIIEHIEY